MPRTRACSSGCFLLVFVLLETKSFNKIFTKEHELQILSQTKVSRFRYVLGRLYGCKKAMFSPLGSPGPYLYSVSQQEDSVLASLVHVFT